MAALIVLTISVKSDNNESALVPVLAIVTAAAGGGAAGCGLLCLFSVRQKVVICENGFTTRSLMRTHTVYWDEIARVYFNMRSTVVREVSVETQDGTKVAIPSMVTGKFAAYQLICDMVRSRLRKELRVAIASGQTVAFGKGFAISCSGLVMKRKTHVWGEVKQIVWGAEHYSPGNMYAIRSALFIETAAGIKQLLTTDIPNLPVLLKVLESDYGVKVKREPSFF